MPTNLTTSKGESAKLTARVELLEVHYGRVQVFDQKGEFVETLDPAESTGPLKGGSEVRSVEPSRFRYYLEGEAPAGAPAGDDYDSQTVTALRKQAKERGLTGLSKADKQTVIAALRA